MNPLSMVKMMGSMMPGNNNSEPELSKEEQKKRNAKYMYKTITKLKAHEVKSLVNAILDSMCIVTSNEQVKDSPHPGDASPTYKGIHSLADELTDTIFSKVVDQLNSEESTSKQTGGGLDGLGSMANDAISSTPTGLAASAGVAGVSTAAGVLGSLGKTAAGVAGSVANTATNAAADATASATGAGAGALGDLTNDESSDDEADIEKKGKEAEIEKKVKEANVEKKDDVSDGEITEDEVDDDDNEVDLKQKTLDHLRKRIIQTIQRGGFESLIKSIKITADKHLNDTDITKKTNFEGIMKIMAEKDIKLLESHMEFMLYKIENSEDNKNIDDYISMILVLKHFNKNNSFDIDVDLNQYKLKNELINQADFDKNKATYIVIAKSNLTKYGLSSYDNIKDDMDKTIDATKLTELIQESQDKTTGGTRRYKKKRKRLTKRNKPRKH